MPGQSLHATAVALNGLAVLLRGPSGAGKSDLALRLIDQGWQLVSDDQTEVRAERDTLIARAPAAIVGQMEVRGLGIQDIPALVEAPVRLVVDLVPAESVERLPETREREILGVKLPHLSLNAFEISTVAKLRLALLAADPPATTGRVEPKAEKNDRSESSATAGVDPEERTRQPVVLVTGQSGAGRSTALKALEDLGYEAIDNLPLDLLSTIVGEGSLTRPVAIGIDIRTRKFAAAPVLNQLQSLEEDPRLKVTLLFLECDNEILSRRYTATRRRHPLAEGRRISDGIAAERRLVMPLRSRADRVIDTSSLTPTDLGQVLKGQLGLGEKSEMSVFVHSFSFGQGLPQEADFVFDVRFLVNPHYHENLRPLSGMDRQIVDFVKADKSFTPFFGTLTDLLGPLLPRFEASGKSYFTIAFGCTGGRHRSVALAEITTAWLRDQGRQVTLHHRDISRDPQRLAQREHANL
ncbi:MAG: RNase adapter RapZ [Pseudomonadota bacterium]